MKHVDVPSRPAQGLAIVSSLFLQRASAGDQASATPLLTARDEGDECQGFAIRHLLVPLDGSGLAECALPFAVAVAQALSARITLLRVLELRGGTGTAERHVDPVDWEILRAEAHGQLGNLDADLRARGLFSAVAILEGRSAEQIVCFAREHGVDLIVLSSHGEGGLSGWALSSTAQKVIARAHSSLFIVPAYATDRRRIGDIRFDKILVALDCSLRAECVLPLAQALARTHDAELILGHVVPEPEMPRHMPPSPEDVALAGRITERNRVESERYLNAARERLDSQGVRSQIRIVTSSRRARAIRELAEHENADLVLLSAHGSTGDASERHGSVAARLIQESGRPMIVFQDLGGIARETTRAEEEARGHSGH